MTDARPMVRPSIWSVVILICSILFFASGLIFGIIKESVAKSLATVELEVRTTTARVDILEREYAVFNNELRHINVKLDHIADSLERHSVGD